MGDLLLQNVDKSFMDVQVVKKLNLNIAKGQFFTFLGPSGCGKTTTLRMIAGFYYPSAGKIIHDNKDISYQAPNKRNMGMVFQNYALFPHLSVLENIQYGLKVRKMKKSEIKHRCDEYLSIVHLKSLAHRKVSELSGGQQQRVALARALVVEPGVLLLDEPLSNLDAKLREEMRHEIARLQKELGITMVYVTHDQTEALTMSDRIAVFQNGYCQQVGTPKDLYDVPTNKFVAKFIGETNLFDVNMQGNTAVISDSIALKTQHSEAIAISIRHEKIKITASEPSGVNVLQGTVEHIEYNGRITTYKVNVSGTIFFVAAFNASYSENIGVGSHAYLQISPEDIHMLNSDVLQ